MHFSGVSLSKLHFDILFLIFEYSDTVLLAPVMNLLMFCENLQQIKNKKAACQVGLVRQQTVSSVIQYNFRLLY